ncbi:MAG TPA: right-handed parallel beta-helix repeat-containing protein [Firmicutes bacterium]|nr:right-handed parallel beta-helix repeat-containing protein [Bacillota bacterium]
MNHSTRIKATVIAVATVLLLGLLCGAALAEGADILYVDAGVASDGDGSEDAPFKTIQAAVNAAADPATILVEAGEYEETVVVDRPGLLLKAALNHEAIVKGRVEIKADSVRLEGFRIERQEAGAPGIKVTECKDITIYNNIVDGLNVPGSGKNNAGIQLDFGVGGNTLIENNTVKDHSGNGIWVDLGGALRVEGNIIEGNLTGINFNNCSSAGTTYEIKDNQFIGNNKHAISIGSSGELKYNVFTITGNRFDGNAVSHFSDRRYDDKEDKSPAPGREAVVADNEIAGGYHWVWNETRWLMLPEADWIVEEDTEIKSIDEAGGTLEFDCGVVLITDQETGAVAVTKVRGVDQGAPAEMVPAGIYLRLERSEDLVGTAIRIEVAYDPDELPEGLAEDDLKLYRYNEETGQWDLIANQGVDKEGKFLWADLEEFSLFGIFADAPEEPAGPEEPVDPEEPELEEPELEEPETEEKPEKEMPQTHGGLPFHLFLGLLALAAGALLIRKKVIQG